MFIQSHPLASPTTIPEPRPKAPPAPGHAPSEPGPAVPTRQPKPCPMPAEPGPDTQKGPNVVPLRPVCEDLAAVTFGVGLRPLYTSSST